MIDAENERLRAVIAEHIKGERRLIETIRSFEELFDGAIAQRDVARAEVARLNQAPESQMERQ